MKRHNLPLGPLALEGERKRREVPAYVGHKLHVHHAGHDSTHDCAVILPLGVIGGYKLTDCAPRAQHCRAALQNFEVQPAEGSASSTGRRRLPRRPTKAAAGRSRKTRGAAPASARRGCASCAAPVDARARLASVRARQQRKASRTALDHSRSSSGRSTRNYSKSARGRRQNDGSPAASNT